MAASDQYGPNAVGVKLLERCGGCPTARRKARRTATRVRKKWPELQVLLARYF